MLFKQAILSHNDGKDSTFSLFDSRDYDEHNGVGHGVLSRLYVKQGSFFIGTISAELWHLIVREI